MKKYLLLFLLVFVPSLVFSYDVVIDGIYYNLITKANFAEVTFGDYNYTGDVTIPSSVKYEGVEYPVTTISFNAFKNCYELNNIYIPNSVTFIGDYAFYLCESLTNVSIPAGVTSLGDGVFQGCYSLKTIKLPENLVSIGAYAFRSCKCLTSIDLPNSVTKIGQEAFVGCSSLTTISIPNQMEYISQYTFEHCTSLTSVAIPNSVIGIGQSAFANCTSLTSIVLPDSMKRLGMSVFKNCSGLTSVIFSKGITEIDNGAFYYCTNLTSIDLPESVTKLGLESFGHCNSLTSVSIGCGINYIGEKAFSYCNSLEDFFCHAEKVPHTITDAFEGSYPEYAKLHVPFSSIEEYGSSAPWSDFGEILALPIDTIYVEKISFNNDNLKLERGESAVILATIEPANATISTLTWTSSDENVVTVENGKVTAVNSGSALVTASANDGSGIFHTCQVIVYVPVKKIELSEVEATINTGNTMTLSVSISPEDATDKSVTWTSSNPQVAVVDNGVVTGINTGTVQIIATANDGSGVSDTCVVTVVVPVSSITLSESFVDMKKGETITLAATINPNNATDKSLIWTSSDESIAKVDNGKVTALEIGNATITATANDGSGVSASCMVIVSPVLVSSISLSESYISIEKGESTTIYATVNPDNATNPALSWSSSNETVAKVDNGVIFAIGVGTTMIRASATDGSGVMVSCQVTVLSNIFKITYMLDNELYKVVSCEHGAIIERERDLEREGYTFSGWNGYPNDMIMPGYDITITGYFSINTYQLTYMLEEEVYSVSTLNYREKIIPIDPPERDGYIFSGWMGFPEDMLMPAHDVTVIGYMTSGVSVITMDSTDSIYYFDLFGNKIKVPKRGQIYIYNGKKIMSK